MKKLQLLVLVLVLVAFGSCKKESTNQKSTTPKFVSTINASYQVKDGDLQLKDAPVGVNRTFTLYTRNSPFYLDEAGNPLPIAKVTGKEFITGSVAQVWWADPANNPNSFPVTTGIYANQTPDWDVRQVAETKNAAGQTAYLAMVDFHPAAPLFPLTLNGFRLGDFLQINTDELTSKPGGENLSFQVVYQMKPVNLEATKVKLPLTGVNPAVPNGTEFCWNDIVYGPEGDDITFDLPRPATGNQTIYDGVEGKIVEVDIIVTDHGTGGMPTRSITKHLEVKEGELGGAGKSTLMILKTTKQGWYDSATNGFTESDITVSTANVVFN